MCRQGILLDVSVPQVEDDPLVYEAMLKIVRNDFNGAQDCIERVSRRPRTACAVWQLYNSCPSKLLDIQLSLVCTCSAELCRCGPAWRR
jgi:hypothetical protein